MKRGESYNCFFVCLFFFFKVAIARIRQIGEMFGCFCGLDNVPVWPMFRHEDEGVVHDVVREGKVSPSPHLEFL